MEIFEDEYQWALLGERLEEAAPGAERLVAPIHTGVGLAAQPNERA